MDKTKALKQFKELQKDVKSMRLAAENWKNPFQTLIATIMSARTRDETTIEAAKKLFKKYPHAKSLSKAKLSEIKKTIKPVNFYIGKSKKILNCSKDIVKNHKGKVPRKFEELIKLPGVGRKTANVFLSEYGDDEIGVDTHVQYISRYLGWTRNNAQKKIEKDLKELFPKKMWGKINPVLVRFGKTHNSKKEKNKILDRIKKIK